jgi:hypothetical protein
VLFIINLTEWSPQEEVYKGRESVNKRRRLYWRHTVRDVVVANVVEEEPAHPAKKGPVDGCGSSAKERPFSFPVVRDGGVRVVQECEHDNPINQSGECLFLVKKGENIPVVNELE